ncbi:MAG: phosphatase PAP2 family protein [Acidobacteriota bacterium]
MPKSLPFYSSKPRFRVRRRGQIVCVLMVALSLSCRMLAEQVAPAQPASASLPNAPQPQAQSHDEVTVLGSPRDILHDQKVIWTSPLRLRTHDLKWLVPFALATGAAIATDHRAMSQVVSRDPSFNNASVNASNAVIGGFIALPVAIYGYGHFEQDNHARVAGILGGEAMVDAVAVEQGMKLVFWRERPAVDSARGRFFQSSAGVDSSFPSSHSVVAWATAATVAGEYPSPWTQLAVYSAAAGVSLTRVMGQQHFPSDVLVGSVAGWLVGHYVAHRHRKLLAETERH